MKNKEFILLNKKNRLKTFLFVVVFIISSEIFSDWEHFKDGLLGRVSKTECIKNK
ncbi:MAG: hypothetical protein HRT66_02855 [Flavobacteriaceae bacterium]|nr:hypothetical protein [Flavobacteriaceae bacterium]